MVAREGGNGCVRTTKPVESKAVYRHYCVKARNQRAWLNHLNIGMTPSDRVFCHFGDCQAQSAAPSALPGLSTASNVNVS